MSTIHGTGRVDDPLVGAEEIGPIAARTAWRLVSRYTPLYAAFGVLLLIAGVLPSRIDRGLFAAPATGSVDPAGIAAPDVAAVPAGSGTAPPDLGVFTPPVATTDVGDLASAPPLDDDLPAPTTTDAGEISPPDPTDPGEFGELTTGQCPIELGEDPVLSRGVAAVLLGVASPALSALGPFGPNAVPALGLVSPILPVAGVLADAFGPYIRMLNPLFLQASQASSDLWAGPLRPLEPGLLELNAAYVTPFEVELIAAATPVIQALNDTPVTPCLTRLVYNIVAPIPLP
jgi:hypothetical protein